MRPIGITLTPNTDVTGVVGPVINLAQADWDGYTHGIRDVGGFWAATFKVLRPRDELEELFRDGLDRRVAVQARSGARAWEGYVDELALQVGGVELRKSLTRMANRVWVRYESGGTPGQRSTNYDDATSQALYGRKERPFSGGQAVSAGQANQIAQVLLSRLKSPNNPSPRWAGTASGLRPTLQVRCKGWWHKLYWRVYNQTALTATCSVTALVQRVLDSLATTVTVNLAKNPSFEVNVTDDWSLTGGGGTATRTRVADAMVGGYSCELKAGTANANIQTVTNISVANGETITAQARVRCEASPAGNRVYLGIYDLTTPGVRASMYATKVGEWELLTCTWTNTTGVAKNCILFVENDFNDNATKIWVDAVQFEKQALSPYADGTLVNCAWAGTAHNSNTSRTARPFFDRIILDTNSTQVQEKYDADMWCGDILSNAVKIGDANFNRWVIGVYEDRTLYFQQAAASRPASMV